MPPERTHAANPHGRQKSCFECARSKRRCDLRLPRCLRCTRLSLGCSYPPPVLPTTQATPDSPALLDAPITGDLCFDIDAPDFDDLLHFSAHETSSAFREFFDLEDPKGGTLGPIYAPNPLSPHLRSFTQSRLDFPVEQMKGAPSMMVLENQTLWSHPQLYKDHMPPSLQSNRQVPPCRVNAD